MITLYPNGGTLLNGEFVPAEKQPKTQENKDKTMAYGILKSHNTSGSMDNLQIKFDAMASHDITFVGIIQTARASGMKEFPLPYVLTNCHNSLCAVGGTINEDDHQFGLSAAKKYGGIYVPPHMAVIHEYMREQMAAPGKMILGSDSHTRYGALGTMAIGEGGGELAKQLLSQTYDISYPSVILVYLKGTPRHGVGPQDVALKLVGEVFKNGFVKNSVLEFAGPGIFGLSMDFRNGIDVMTTETTCLSSIWVTDEKTRDYLKIHGRESEYQKIEPTNGASYDKAIVIDLSKIKPMIALPMHPSNAFEIDELNGNLEDILRETEKSCQELIGTDQVKISLTNKIVNGKLKVDQGVIAGCSGGIYENLALAGNILKGHSIGNDTYSLSLYPSSMPLYMYLNQIGVINTYMEAGAIVRSAFCGPCFGAGDVPFDGALSIRHTTRNFPSREGSKPAKGQIASVALMDARSIAATSINGGYLTSAEHIDYEDTVPEYEFNPKSYESRVYQGWKNPNPAQELKLGPNITDWPEMPSLEDNLVLKISSFITDPVTTTDELIPSGETSSFRSNPLGLAEFTLSRKDPEYVSYAKEIATIKDKPEEIARIKELIGKIPGFTDQISIQIGSCIYANKPGDGSAREQAASCQRVLGASANIAKEYATKRYRSNLINWGMLPFTIEKEPQFKKGSLLFIPNLLSQIDKEQLKGYILEDHPKEITLKLGALSDKEKAILKAGCLINYNKNK